MSTENCTGIRTFCVASPIFTLPTIVAVYRPGAVPAGTVSRKATGVSVPFVTFVPFGSANQAAGAGLHAHGLLAGLDGEASP